MIVLNKVKRFVFLDLKTKILFIEAFLLLGWGRILKTVPFAKIAPLLGDQMGETSYILDEHKKTTLRDVSEAVNLMSKYTFWESMCLVKAIAAMKMLERRKIESTIYFGTSRNESGKMIAHAWLRSGPFYITGSEGMEKFTVVGKYAKKIKK